MDNFEVNDLVHFISKPFGFRDKDKLWFVVKKNNEVICLEADDRLKLTYPNNGTHIVHIFRKYWKDVKIFV